MIKPHNSRRMFATIILMLALWPSSLSAILINVPPATLASAPGEDASRSSVTLITGDRVTLTRFAHGRSGISVEPGPNRQGIAFFQTWDRTHTSQEKQATVIPSDAVPLLAAGLLDPQLFNVSELIRQGFGGPGAPPLIITSRKNRSLAASRMSSVAGLRTVRTLPSINGLAVAEAKEARAADGALWRWLTGTDGARQGAVRDSQAALRVAEAAGIEKVWLDSRLQPLLDQSVPQIGVPVARQAGLTGRGVSVAVLDTGIKIDHPDLVGKVIESEDFTDTRPDATDDVGHGTHVAGIIASSAAASNGQYMGVAPDVSLLNGKVCDLSGCLVSAIIAGMEWAAPKARIINMSLGGPPTDGTDPVSQAVNSLTAQTGTLFVIAAGNSGREGTVAAPAVADAALSVGSVTKQDALSGFSSRGPRLGDFAIKPDLTAPGSDIVSTRAPGTFGGDRDPINEHYNRLSGTSMAAPHVAGAAALLAQLHPDWDASRIKSVLMSTAQPIANASVYDQGVGRVDVARATVQPLVASVGSLSFGVARHPHNQPPVTRTVTYTNESATAVTLNLTLAVTDAQGMPAAPGMFTLNANQVSVPAQGTAEVNLTLNPAAGALGLHGGYLTATAATGSTTVRTAVGVLKEPESYDLTLRLNPRTGGHMLPFVRIFNLETGEGVSHLPTEEISTLRLVKGRYDVKCFLTEFPIDGTIEAPVTTMAEPGLSLLADRTVTLDARNGKPVGAVVDRVSAILQAGWIGLFSKAGNHEDDPSISFLGTNLPLYAVPTRAVSGHTFNFGFVPMLAPSPLSTGPNLIYNLVLVKEGRIPDELQFRVRDRELAIVQADYHAQGVATLGNAADFAYSPKLNPNNSGAFFSLFPVPNRRTELYTVGDVVSWLHRRDLIVVGGVGGSESIFSHRPYRKGEQSVVWNRAPLGPAFFDEFLLERPSVIRLTDNRLAVRLALFSPNQKDQSTITSFGSPPTGTMTLSRDGQVLGTSAQPQSTIFQVPSNPGTYTLTTTANRNVPWSVLGTRTDVSWTFHEPGAAAQPQPLPLMVVRATGRVDAFNRAAAGQPYLLSLNVQRQAGAPSSRLSQLGMEVSFDDGASWAPVRVNRIHDFADHHVKGIEIPNAVAVVRHPAADGFVSLRFNAGDAAGNSVTQTMIRAYQIVQTR